MKTFSERWDQIVQLLREGAHFFGITDPEERIAHGDFVNNKDFAVPPAALVYLDAGDLITLGDSAEACACTILFFWPVEETIPQAIGQAVDHARELWRRVVASGIPITRPGPPVRIAAVQSGIVVISIQFLTVAR